VAFEALEDAGLTALLAATLLLELAFAFAMSALAYKTATQQQQQQQPTKRDSTADGRVQVYIALAVGLNPLLAAASFGGPGPATLRLSLALFLLAVQNGTQVMRMVIVCAWRPGRGMAQPPPLRICKTVPIRFSSVVQVPLLSPAGGWPLLHISRLTMLCLGCVCHSEGKL
jgi:hypothetical protein